MRNLVFYYKNITDAMHTESLSTYLFILHQYSISRLLNSYSYDDIGKLRDH